MPPKKGEKKSTAQPDLTPSFSLNRPITRSRSQQAALESIQPIAPPRPNPEEAGPSHLDLAAAPNVTRKRKRTPPSQRHLRQEPETDPRRLAEREPETLTDREFRRVKKELARVRGDVIEATFRANRLEKRNVQLSRDVVILQVGRRMDEEQEAAAQAAAAAAAPAGAPAVGAPANAALGGGRF